jgi:hypothetical protein
MEFTQQPGVGSVPVHRSAGNYAVPKREVVHEISDGSVEVLSDTT